MVRESTTHILPGRRPRSARGTVRAAFALFAIFAAAGAHSSARAETPAAFAASAGLVAAPATAAASPSTSSAANPDPEVAALLEKLSLEVKASPNSGVVHGRLGLAYDANAMLLSAISSYREAVRLAPGEPKWHYQLARMLAENGDVSGALGEVGEALRLRSDYSPAHHLRGDWLLSTGALDEAEKSYKLALNWDATSVAARVGLARVALQRGNPADAVTRLEAILNEGTESAYIFQLLGNALRRSGNEALAKEAFARAANPREPVWPDPWRDERKEFEVGLAADLERATVLLGGGQIEEGVALLERLRPANPGNAALLTNLGAAYCQLQRLPEGIAALEEAIRDRPEHVPALMNLSQAYEAAGRPGEALAAAERAAKAHPELSAVQARLGHLFAKAGRKEEALRAFDASYRLDSRAVTSLFWCGALRSELGEWGQAAEDFQSVLEQEPRMVGATIHLAKARAESGDLAGARAALAEAEKQTPPPAELETVRARIAELESTGGPR